MSELYLEYGQDLVLTPNGSVQFATGWDESRQFFVRALLTNPLAAAANGGVIPPDYVFHPTFGVGGGQFVGLNLNSPRVADAFNQRCVQAAASTPNLDPTTPPALQLSMPQAHEYLAIVTLTLVNNQTGQVSLSIA